MLFFLRRCWTLFNVAPIVCVILCLVLDLLYSYLCRFSPIAKEERILSKLLVIAYICINMYWTDCCVRNQHYAVLFYLDFNLLANKTILCTTF